MAVSDSSKVDLLYKKLFGVAKTDTPVNKGASNESIASPAINRGDKVWIQSRSIPTTAAAVSGIVQAYQTTGAIQCVADTTSTAISSVYPTWKTNLTDWIPPEFGSTYFVAVYSDSSGASNPVSTGTQMFDSGIGGVGEWFFDYQSGILNFIGGTIPAALTVSKVVFITGYRYIGQTGTSYLIANTGGQLLSGNVAISNTTVSTSNTTGALTVAGGLGVTGNVYLDGITITSNNFTANAVTIDGGSF